MDSTTDVRDHMTIELHGNWHKGLAFDVHTLSSTYLGPDENGYEHWENVRSEMGELLYQLKYRGDKTKIQTIIQLLDRIKGIENMDLLIPIPSTNRNREFQPVVEIARALGAQHGVETLDNVLHKTPGGSELNNVLDTDEREHLLNERIHLTPHESVPGSKIFLVDDLYRSGATLRAATSLLYEQGNAATVNVLTMTRTRSRR